MSSSPAGSTPTIDASIHALRVALTNYDPDGTGRLSAEHRRQLQEDFRLRRGPAYDIIKHRYLNGKDDSHHGGVKGAVYRTFGKEPPAATISGLTDAHLKMIEEDLESSHLAGRYAAFAGMAARVTRYLAYTSDFGEAFRPLAHPLVVRGSYGISWLYVTADVAMEAYALRVQQKADMFDTSVGTFKRAIFQSVASMALPAFTIHEVVRQSNKLFHSVSFLKPAKVWGPTVCGLAVVPALPFMFDHPVEHVVDAAFDLVWAPKFAMAAQHH